eukprot:5151423-Pyramimonas_sp.AAC.1
MKLASHVPQRHRMFFSIEATASTATPKRARAGAHAACARIWRSFVRSFAPPGGSVFGDLGRRWMWTYPGPRGP